MSDRPSPADRMVAESARLRRELARLRDELLRTADSLTTEARRLRTEAEAVGESRAGLDPGEEEDNDGPGAG